MLPREEYEQLNSRITLILACVVVAFGILGFGFWKHQIAESLRYSQLAERNRVREVPLAAPRGRILDREGRVIADSRRSYRLVIRREGRQRPIEETLEMLAQGLEESAADLMARFLEQEEAIVPYLPVVLSEDLSPEEMVFVEARRFELPDVSVEFRPMRRYEVGSLAAHVVGYVGEISERQLGSESFPDRRPGDVVGKTGLELQYDAFLQGREGFRRVNVNNVDREIGLLAEQPYRQGPDLVTTIDLDLQRVAEQALGDRTGAVVAILPRTGEVVALASLPSFDPTLFAEGIGQSELQALTSDPRKPFQNRAIQNRYSPGSVFKVFMAAAGLAEHLVDPHETIFCPGYATLHGSRFGCWREGGHGSIGLHEALVHSCNVFFYHVGNRLEIERIAAHSTAMGLGRATGIDLPGEDPGLIPSEAWKRSTYAEPWYPGETISVSIGQGAVSVTPLQLTWALGGLAVGGTLVEPRLVSAPSGAADAPETRSYPVESEVLEIIRSALWDVVNGGGTGSAARVAGFDVAGKTGTAQVVGRAAYGTSESYEDHAWFVGFAPFDDPEIAVGVFVEHGGGGGSAAGPVAQAVFREWFEKTRGVITRNTPFDPATSSD